MATKSPVSSLGDAAAVGNPPLPDTEEDPGNLVSEVPEIKALVTTDENPGDPINNNEEIAVNHEANQEVDQTPTELQGNESEEQEEGSHLVSEQAPTVTNEATVDEVHNLPSCSDLPSPAEGGAVIETEYTAAPQLENGNCLSDGEVPSDATDEPTSSEDSQASQEGTWCPPTHCLDAPVTTEVKELPLELGEDGAKNSEIATEIATEIAAEGESSPGGQNDDAKPEEASSSETAEEAPIEVEQDAAKNSEMPGEIPAEGELIPEGQNDRKPEADSSVEACAHAAEQLVCRDSSNDDLIGSPEPTVGDTEDANMDADSLESTSSSEQNSTCSVLPRASTDSQTADDDVAQPSVTSDEQQREQPAQDQPALGCDDQEATQQVFNPGTPPPATVAMEPANQDGEADSLGPGCAAVTREREREKGEEGTREGEATGGESEQKVSGLDTEEEEEEQKQKEEIAGASPGVEIEGEKEEEKSDPEENTGSKMETTDSYDDSQSDSGVSGDFSPCGTVELQAAPEPTPSPPANETPIEREIRRAVQREQSLRRSRGLQQQPAGPEYVDIPLRKAVLTQPLPSKFDKGQGKDRQFAGKKMQKEISLEAQREQVLVQLGKVPGFYDKGTVRQLKERKQLFEAFQEPKDLPSILSSSSVLSPSVLSPHSKAPSWTSASDLSTLEVSGDESSNASTIGGSFIERRGGSPETVSPVPASDAGLTYTPHLGLGPGLSEGTGSPVIILGDHLVLPAAHPGDTPRNSISAGSTAEGQSLTVVDSAPQYASPLGLSGDGESQTRRDSEGRNVEDEEEEGEEDESVPRENPFFKLRASTALKVGQDIRESKERERELRMQRSSLYGAARAGGVGAGGGGGSVGGSERPASREVKSSRPLNLPANGLATPDRPVAPLKIGTPTVRQSLGKLGMWPPVQPNEEEPTSQPECPRTPRQKTPLLERWESGLVNGHGGEEEEDDD